MNRFESFQEKYMNLLQTNGGLQIDSNMNHDANFLILSDYMYTAIKFRVAVIFIRTQSRGMVWFIYVHRIFVNQYTSYLWNTERVSASRRAIKSDGLYIIYRANFE